MTTDTKEDCKSGSESKVKKENSSSFYHIYRVEIDPDMEHFDHYRDRINREMLAVIARLKNDFPGIKLFLKTEVSTPFEDIGFL